MSLYRFFIWLCVSCGILEFVFFFFVFSLYDVHSLLSHYVFVCFFERPRAIIFIFLAPQPARIEMLIKKSCHGRIPSGINLCQAIRRLFISKSHAADTRAAPTQPREMLKEFRPSWEVCIAFCTRLPCMHARSYLYSTNITRLYYIFH